MNRKHTTFAALSVLSAALLSAGFLFPHCGGFALFAFVPLLWMDRIATEDGVRHFWWWHYLTFVLWNAFTTFWVCNATVAGGIGAILANAFQMSVIWAAFRLFKKHFNGILPYIFLAAAWTAWERFYFHAEISWPWLTLGNAFAMSHSCIQWYEITGTLGGSLWIWLCNLGVFGISLALQDGRWGLWNKKARASAAVAVAAILFVPLGASWIRYATLGENGGCGKRVEIRLLQPNMDPYSKFTAMSQAEQNEILTGLMREGYDEEAGDGEEENPVLMVAPEAITNDIVLGDPNGSPTLRTVNEALEGHPGAHLLFGASTYEFFLQGKAPSYTARQTTGGVWYENHNSAVMTGGPRTEFYHKSCLVLGTEKMPWPRITSRIEKALGGNLMGHCIGQDRVSLLHFGEIPVGCAVCYESIYPEHVASYVKAGAGIIAVITNDAWWGDTPGYRQHLYYSCLRAIETRRDIARSANTGISAFINRRGDIVSRTGWWERCVLDGHVRTNSEITPFVRYGDVTGRLCTLLAVLLALALAVKMLISLKVRGR